MASKLFIVALVGLVGSSLAAPQQQTSVKYPVPSGSVSYSRQGAAQVRYVQPTTVQYVQQPQLSYVQPAVQYVQPAVKTVKYVQQPQVSYVQQPQVSYVHQQPHVSVVQPQIATTKISSAQPIAILKFVQDQTFDGNFVSEYQSENGISSESRGSLKAVPGSELPGQVMQGSYSYTAPDGTPIVTTWYADETGFHAEGDHLPVPPPIPEAIARSLEYIRSLPPQPEDKKYQ